MQQEITLTGQKFLNVEINKGMKLSKFVSIKSAV
jgi:hypothetical protein